MNWQPSDFIRLAALIAGFLLCCLGAFLMWLGVGAEGAVDIRSSVLSGSIKTGSAGLFILFFGFGIIIFVLGSLAAKSANAQLNATQKKSRTRHLAWVFWGVLVAFIIMVALGSMGFGQGFGVAAFFLGFVLAFAVIAFVVQLENE